MAMVVNVGFVEINSCTLKRIEGNDEVAVRGVVCERQTLCAAALNIPNQDARRALIATSKLVTQTIE